ncbi:hypothetical protein MUN81_22505 (plasmid) [Hymenobacter sp. 5317J-9]|uniref:hypothetical protein n=1 Tax=Hymenobacter sp. 5317J-9 TaxID=2932250 RepID=UPI001FD6389C|nr:hypothetical protein [Hymenobacter sp. 5317J-9]UOR00215.1 hypothetical protein MUN81_22505 [Hymenobacter sp. 5317J-9]
MPYVPRAAVPAACAHCGVSFAARHLRRKYCCNSCNVLAARARKKARPVPPPGPVACPLPAHFRAAVGPTRALGAPYRLDPAEAVDYALGPEYWVQAHKSQAPVNWEGHRRGSTYATREFYVGASGHVWVRSSLDAHRLVFVNAVGPRLEAFSRLCWQEEDPGPWTE